MKRLAVWAGWVFLVLVSSHFALAGSAMAEEIVIGINIPLSGPYKTLGEEEKRGYEVAIEDINANGGVLGSQISPVFQDTETNAKAARKNTLEMIWNQNAAMITGGVSSEVSIAQSAEAQEQGVVYMTAVTHANATTGHMVTKAGFVVQSAHRHTFRWFLNAWMTSNALGPVLVDEFGRDTNYFFIAVDDIWGRDLEESMRRMLELAGSDTVGSVSLPLGSKDYRKAMEKAKDAEANVLILCLFGEDQVTALKQAKEMGLADDMNIVVPLSDIDLAKAAGGDVMKDVYTTNIWYWNLPKKYPGSKKFVDMYQKKFKRPPSAAAAAAWVAVHQWAEAVEKAQDFYADDKIILALEGHKFTLLKEQEEWRPWDHQCISSVYVMRGKDPEKMSGEWDLFEVVSEKPGKDVMRSKEENPVSLEPLVIEE